MHVLIDVVAAASGGGVSRSRELARTLPTLTPELDLTYVARSSVAHQIRGIHPEANVILPPPGLSNTLGRLAWEHTVLPSAATRRIKPDAVFSPFNVAPTRWSGSNPVIGVIVSNLAPFSSELLRLYRGRERSRLWMLRVLTERSLRCADRIFLLSRQAYPMIGDELLDGKAELIPMAPPPVLQVEACSARAPQGPYVLVVADLLRYKGVEWVLEALSRIGRNRRPKLLIAGRPIERGYVRDLRERERELRVDEDVDWLGSIAHADVLSLMGGARACIVPSRFENGSRVSVEAMAVGVPIIATDVPAFREACGPAAAYFGPARADELAERIQHLATDEGARRHYVEAGRRRLAAIDPASASERVAEWLTGLA